MTIGDRLLKLRKEKNLSQEELANELDVSRQSISKWETNQTTPDFDKIVTICEYFGITTDELLTGNKDIVEAKETNIKNNYARNIAISVGLYIFSLVTIILFAAELNKPVIGVCLFFSLIAIATGLIVYSVIMYGKKTEKIKKEGNTQMELVIKTADILAVVIYFLVSFMTGAWHITWIIFLIMAAVDEIIRILYSFKDEKAEKVEKVVTVKEEKEETSDEQSN